MAKHLRCIPLTLKDANKFVNQYHRHNKDCRGHRFSIGAIYKAIQVWQVLGGKKVITYTLETEKGSSLKAVNFKDVSKTPVFKYGWTNRKNRILPETQRVRKVRWEKEL